MANNNLSNYQYPRLTRGLRAFVREDDIFEHPALDVQQITTERCQLKTKENEVSWEDINSELKKYPQGKGLLQDLYQHARDLVGEESVQVIEDNAAYLFKYFLEEKTQLSKHTTDLKYIYGIVTPDKTTKIFQNVRSIAELINLDGEDLKQLKTKKKHEKKYFGKDLKIVTNVSRRWQPDDTSKLTNMTLTSKDDVFNSFSMKYDNTVVDKASTSKEPIKYSQTWLLKEISNCYTECSSDIVDSITNRLKLDISNDELQNELFELLGFERFELIQDLLQHRKEIVESSVAEDRKYLAIRERMNTDRPNEPKRPTVASQVIFHSESEKYQQKLARKEEKKIQKVISKMNDDDIDLIERRPIVPTASSMPIFVGKRKSPENYPNVYDVQNTIKSTAGFISGQKIMLPSGIERTDNRTYEQFVIPVSEPAPLHVGKDKVKISALHKIGQIAFEGIKELNRIQSVVFETAYHTNENMLVCAPTGAGKTNVALLTVAHEIEQNVDDSGIKKNSFKIVYVAPMKALAAEMTGSFGKRLAALGLTVKELTGDMQLTKAEIMETQMLVTTPEKWDVVTRKGTGDVALTKLVKLLIIDEVHLLHGDRGPVVEALVARTLRQVESSQSMIRIVGLSATLPNYLDVARFLRVNPHIGLFYFDSRFRPVPMSQTFIGVKAVKPVQQMADMDSVCYEKVLEQVQKGHQVMVFVHARNATVRTASVLKEMAAQKNQLQAFEPESSSGLSSAIKSMGRSRNRQVADLLPYGFSCHHAGMLRSDRSLVEKYFAEGYIKVLVCTATLAWGVNLPAHAVIIRGTEIYDAKRGSFVDLGILDVLQIFGRAGRPQYDKSGLGIIITAHDKLSHYLSLLTDQFPIESNFINFLADNLNAEVTLGTISNVNDAVEWLSYTYLFVRMRVNPQMYGINYQDVEEDPYLEKRRLELIDCAAKALDKAKMVRYNERTGDLNVTDLGRTASYFYIKYDTVEVFNELMRPIMVDSEIFAMVSNAQEFEQLKVRDDEMNELDELMKEYCNVEVLGGSENLHGKVNILLQTYLSRGRMNSFSLQSDQSYIIQNAVRIVRALFDIALRKNNAIMSARFLLTAKMLELQIWDWQSPLRQFTMLGFEVMSKLEGRHLTIERLRDMHVREIGEILKHPRMGQVVKNCAEEFPLLKISATLQPITRTVLRIRLLIKADFKWNDRIHGKKSEAFWIWIEDSPTNFIYHSEYFLITKKQVVRNEEQELIMTIPLTEPLPPQYFVRAESDRWISSVVTEALSFQHLILPESHPPHTDLLPLQPLPVSALNNPEFEKLYKFSHFNPIQTQIFHCLYHTDCNVLLGAPTGSGKTIAAEIAMFRVFREYPKAKVVYIAPLKALVRERIEDWKIRLEKTLNRRVVELTGDVTPDVRAIARADVIVTTPEKWDGISRSWQTRNYVRDVALIIIDEIHLLGEDRGPVLEVIVSRTNFIASHTTKTLRIIGLSTALANARDLANWLSIKDMGLYNFRPSVRPVPLEVHIAGFPGKHYCPRMATMNKPTFQAIRQHSPAQPSLIFVSSRRQTRLTALDLIAFLAAEDNPKQWLHMSEHEMEQIVSNTKDQNLKLTLAFGIGMHHAGLQERDRKTVEELFVNQKIQVLIATATLAWGVNFPAHLVVVKGTEYYDGKLKRYVDMPITDVLQMMGRAGRPQYDEQGVAVVLVHDVKKNFYKKFLYEPFPVESSLLAVLPDHLNAEIVAGTIKTIQDALDYLTWTYFFRRLIKNPTYYNLDALEPENVNGYLSQLVAMSVDTLNKAFCVQIDSDERTLHSTSMGKIASYYYLSHQTMYHFTNSLRSDLSLEDLVQVLADVHEYEQLPVRHNEDILNGDLAKMCPLPVNQYALDSPHTKAQLLFQAHFSRIELPCADYFTDLKSVLDQAIRILQAMIDVSAEQGWLTTTLLVQQLMQMVIQASWVDLSPLLTLPYVEQRNLIHFKRNNVLTLPVLQHMGMHDSKELAVILKQDSKIQEHHIHQMHQVLTNLPIASVDISIRGWWINEQKEKEKHCSQPMKKDNWLEVNGDQEYTIIVRLKRLNRNKDGNKAYTPRFPRGTDEGWFLTLGNVEAKELIAMKRVPTIRGNTCTQVLTFLTPKQTGRIILTLYLFSDCYLGLDQQYSINLEVLPSNIDCQINSEHILGLDSDNEEKYKNM